MLLLFTLDILIELRRKELSGFLRKDVKCVLNALYTCMIVVSIASTVACLSALKFILITVIFILYLKALTQAHCICASKQVNVHDCFTNDLHYLQL